MNALPTVASLMLCAFLLACVAFRHLPSGQRGLVVLVATVAFPITLGASVLFLLATLVEYVLDAVLGKNPG